MKRRAIYLATTRKEMSLDWKNSMIDLQTKKPKKKHVVFVEGCRSDTSKREHDESVSLQGSIGNYHATICGWKYAIRDNDPKNSPKSLNAWFRKHNLKAVEWPSQSPGLNPIEKLWGELKRQVSKLSCNRKKELWENIQHTCYYIPLEICQKFISDMSKTVEAVFKSIGGNTVLFESYSESLLLEDLKAFSGKTRRSSHGRLKNSFIEDSLYEKVF